MKVTLLSGEYLTYEVEGSVSLPHRVELLAYAGNGECTCKDFQFRCLPNLKRLAMAAGGFSKVCFQPYFLKDGINEDRSICKHIHVSQQHLLRSILKQLAETQDHY